METIEAELNATVDALFDALPPGNVGDAPRAAAVGAKLQAASQRQLVPAISKLTVAPERNAEAQEATNRRIERLEKVVLGVAIAGVVLAAAQIAVAFA
jgi:hypothetical protein